MVWRAGWMVGAALGASVASAQEVPAIDLEMVRPGLSPRGGFAVDAPHAIATKTWSVGALFQYQNAPLRLFDGEDLVGPVVLHRTVAQIHAGIAASKRTSFSLIVPIAGQFGADEDVENARNGAGLGDIGLTGRVHIGPWDRFSLGVVGTLFLPTGNPDQYLGERLPRLRAGLLGHTDFGRVSLLTNLLAHVRQPVETNRDFVAGSEIQVDVGVIGEVLPNQLDVIGELITRIGVEPGDDGGRLASELLAGVRYKPADGFRVDVAIGRGLTEGYGTTGVRAMLGFAYVKVPKPPPPPPPPIPLVIEEEPLPEAETPEPPPPPPPPPPAVIVRDDRIVVREIIAFEQGTSTLLPESGPILDAIADIMASDGRIGHVLIEGHASEEGGYAYNYALSGDRARAIYEALVERGIQPSRMSHRSAGEVEPLVEGSGDDVLRQNRRVEFRIVEQFQPGDARPVYSDTFEVPWTGVVIEARNPPPLEPEAVSTPEEPTMAPPPDVPARDAEVVDDVDEVFAPIEDDEPVFDDEAPPLPPEPPFERVEDAP